jgi:SAM-dependent methyltransferase
VKLEICSLQPELRATLILSSITTAHAWLVIILLLHLSRPPKQNLLDSIKQINHNNMDSKEEKYYDAWWNEGDQDMEDEHIPHWSRVLGFIPENDLSQKTVLDFGCNQGGFLRLLHEQRGFEKGFGVDIAKKSIEIASNRVGDLPIKYILTDDPTSLNTQFDFAISLAVIYLLPDMDKHVAQMKQCLKSGGVYYATFVDYTGNPSLPAIKKTINENASVPMQDHTLDSISRAFFKGGFKVAVRRIAPVGFVELSENNIWHEKVEYYLQYAYEQAHIFRFTAP